MKEHGINPQNSQPILFPRVASDSVHTLDDAPVVDEQVYHNCGLHFDFIVMNLDVSLGINHV